MLNAENEPSEVSPPLSRHKFGDLHTLVMNKVWFQHRPKCLSFKFCEHETDPLKSIIYERYETKADLDGAPPWCTVDN